MTNEHFAWRAFIVLLVVGCVSAAWAADDRTELKAAFTSGKIELTFTAQDSGATLELRMKNLTTDKLALVIKEGKTPFTIRDNKVFLVAAKAQDIDLDPAGEVTVSFPMEQSGPGRWSGGSVTQTVTPPPAKQ